MLEVCFVAQKQTLSASFDHIVSVAEERRWNGKAKRFAVWCRS
jgi:hypothetical protein